MEPNQINESSGCEESEEKQTLSRRRMLKLAGAITALGAGLGIALDPEGAAGQLQDKLQPGVFQHKGEIQVKFYELPANGDESKATLVTSIAVPSMMQIKLLSVPSGRLQLKVTATGQGNQAGQVNQKVVMGDGSVVLATQPLQLNLKLLNFKQLNYKE